MSPPRSYINASIVQLFYTANTYHDLLYTLGFTESAGNFQWNNSAHGGRDKDYVILNAQDGSGFSNANFATPPDGIPGRMRMYIWIESTPSRDGSFDAGIVIHEYTHGGKPLPLPFKQIHLTNQYRIVSPAAPITPDASAPSNRVVWAKAGATLWRRPSESSPTIHAQRPTLWVHGQTTISAVSATIPTLLRLPKTL